MGSKQHRARQLARARTDRHAARQLAEQRRRRRRAVVAGLVAMVLLLAAVGVLLAQLWGDGASGAAASWSQDTTEARAPGPFGGSPSTSPEIL